MVALSYIVWLYYSGLFRVVPYKGSISFYATANFYPRFPVYRVPGLHSEQIEHFLIRRELRARVGS